MPVVRVLIALVLVVGIAGCQSAERTTEAPTQQAAAGPTPQPYGTLAQVMRAIPFPNSNIIFDTQDKDPAAPVKPGEGGGATNAYAGVYSGWQAVEQAAIALSETANLIMIPGRMCENGLPAPLDREDYRKFAQGLADAGKAALKAAQSKNQDAMIEVSGTVSDACAACHEIYRDKPEGKMRCIP
jgi:cytochrome c556